MEVLSAASRVHPVTPARFAAALLLALLAAPAAAEPLAAQLVAAAAAQIGVTTAYDGAYRRLAYPGGDVEPDRGVCTDVLVRAYRQVGIDLQVAVHEDMQRAFAAYPAHWGLARPDRNIDHRRVPNLQVFFGRHGQSLPPSTDASAYEPGDIVSWMLPSGQPHIGIVAAAATGTRPWIIHNIGAGVQHEDLLFGYRITGHYRYPAR